VRLDLEVTLKEFSQEYVGQPIEEIGTTFTRGEDGEWFSITSLPTP
jgi:hypothetical protein